MIMTKFFFVFIKFWVSRVIRTSCFWNFKRKIQHLKNSNRKSKKWVILCFFSLRVYIFYLLSQTNIKFSINIKHAYLLIVVGLDQEVHLKLFFCLKLKLKNKILKLIFEFLARRKINMRIHMNSLYIYIFFGFIKKLLESLYSGSSWKVVKNYHCSYL